jgi:hypothetical protein
VKKEPFAWHERFPSQVTCVRCLEVKEKREFDRLLWCEDCRALARERAGRWGWTGGVLIAATVAAYIWFVVQPSSQILQLWAAVLVATLWLGAKVVKEIAYGIMRFENRRAAEAVPPSD